MDFEGLISLVARDFNEDPRDKVFANEQLLIASVLEEMDLKITATELRAVIQNYISGDMSDHEEMVYDAAVYACSTLARLCFSDNPEDEDSEIDYEISWIMNEDGTYSAEIRPS